MSEQAPGPAGDFPAGARVAGYRLDEQIGRGGMAVVYRAHDLQLDRQVALKILDPAMAQDMEFQQRFIRESRAAAAVDHPHIIPVFAAGTADGILFIAMRYVTGGDVRALIDTAGQLPAAQVSDIVTQVASALDTAHARGLIHRDVKPANMLLDPATASGSYHVYLSDFGLTKQSLAAAGLTAAGQLLGTLEYVAPEQIESRPVDGRADQYALACTAFEMLAGRPPFSRDQDLEVLWAQLAELAPALVSLRPDLPPAVDQVLAQALAKAPADRFPLCLDFAWALADACLADGSGGRANSGGRAGTGPDAITRPFRTRPWPGAGLSAAAGGAAAVPAPTVPAAAVPAPARPVTTVPATPLPAAALPASAAAAGPDGTLPASPLPRLAEPPGPEPGPQPGPAPGARPPGRRAGRRGRRPAGVLALIGLVVLGVTGTALAVSHGVVHRATQMMTRQPAAVLSPPGCTTRATAAQQLAGVRPSYAALAGMPFAVTVTADSSYSFVSTGTGNSIEVLRLATASTPRAAAPALAGTVSLPGPAFGEAITPDGRYLLAASGSGAYLINVARAERGRPDALAAQLRSPGGSGAVEVVLSPDGRFAFVTLQPSRTVAVFNLQAALASGLAQSGFVGTVRLGLNPVGMAVSQDGRWLYVTTLDENRGPQPGALNVISVPRAETDPATAIRSSVPAGCEPGRVITTSGGTTVWVTARASNALLAFSAARLVSDPAHALIAKVAVGQAPIGLTAVPGGTRILVVNSNLHSVTGAMASLGVIDTTAALAGKPAVLGLIQAGLLPRDVTMAPNGRIALITNSASHQLEAVNISRLR